MGRTLVANRLLAGSACGKRHRVRPLNSVVRLQMEFWYSGEIDRLVYEAYSKARKRVEAALNDALRSQSYGSALNKIAIVPIIQQPGSIPRGERRLFQRASLSADYRLNIPYDAFLHGDEKTQGQLLVRNTVQAVDDIARKAKRARVEFDGERLRADILNVFEMTQSDLDHLDKFAA